MAYGFGINLSPANGSIAMWNIINTLISNGWVKLADSDGTTFSISGSQVTGGGSGTNGLGNQYAYVRLRGPDGNRELIIQRTFTTNVYWRIKYSYLAGFTTIPGTPETVTPSATDEYLLFGSGSDASPGNVILLPSDGTYTQYIVVDTVTGAFAALCLGSGTGDVISWFVTDVLAPSTYPNTDVDPVVFVINAYSGGTNWATGTYINNESAGPFTVLKRGLTGEGIARTPALLYSLPTGIAIPNGIGTNPYTDNDLEFPIIYAKHSGLSNPHGYKGISSLMKFTGVSRSAGDTYNTKSKVIFGDIVFPFDGSSTIAL